MLDNNGQSLIQLKGYAISVAVCGQLREDVGDCFCQIC